MITEAEYKEARERKEAAQETINQFHRERQERFTARWALFEEGKETFTDEELLYAAGARCRECGAGLAYPKSVHTPQWFWSCSAELKGEVKGHPTFEFACYSIKSEDQPSAQGATTRPTRLEYGQPGTRTEGMVREPGGEWAHPSTTRP